MALDKSCCGNCRHWRKGKVSIKQCLLPHEQRPWRRLEGDNDDWTTADFWCSAHEPKEQPATVSIDDLHARLTAIEDAMDIRILVQEIGELTKRIKVPELNRKESEK